MKEKSKKIVRIALTGGPCAGKTTALGYLTQKLGDLGLYTVLVPEAATILINAGIGPKIIGFEPFQRRVFELISALEETVLAGVRDVPSGHVVVIYDRGIPDGRAYVSDHEFSGILASYNSTMTDVRDRRYDAVLHLRTAAFGAEKFYTNTTNSTRYESPEEARTIDDRILSAWVGHPHLRILDNTTPFDEKLKRLLQEVCIVVGIPVPLEIERKFAVQPFDIAAHVPIYQEIDIEQIYLQTEHPEDEARIRKRGQNGSFVYYRTIKRKLASGIRVEREEQITKVEYERERAHQHPGTRPIIKKRTCFVYENQYFEYDRFESPVFMTVLEIELTDRNQTLTFPPFITVWGEVTDDYKFSNAAIARGRE